MKKPALTVPDHHRQHAPQALVERPITRFTQAPGCNFANSDHSSNPFSSEQD
jgi:hypothetical protein